MARPRQNAKLLHSLVPKQVPKQPRKRPDIRTPEAATAAIPSAPVRAPMLWAMAFAVGAALLAASTIAVVIRTYSPVPKWDHWAEILWLKNYYAGQWHVSDLWRQHNEHRILFPRLFLLVDWFLFRGTNVFLLASMLLLQAGHAWIFLREVRAWKELSSAVRLTVSAILVVLFFSGAHLENFTWAFQISFILASYAGTVSLYALIRCAEESEGQKARAAAGWFAACVGSGIVASYSLLSGLLVWPVLLLTGLMAGIRRRLLLSIGAVSILVAVLYASGYRLLPGHTNALDALKHPVDVLYYVCTYLTLPLARINHPLGAVVGGLVLIALAAETFRMLRRPAATRLTSSRLMRLTIGVMLYIAAGAFLTALGRLALGPPDAFVRYATPVSIFWACAVLFVLARTAVLRQRSAAVAAALAVAIIGLMLTIVPLHLDNSFRFLQFRRAVQDAEMALRTGIDAPEIGAIYPDPSHTYTLADVLREHHRSLFAGNQLTAGEPLRPDFAIAGRDRCRGVWEFTTPFERAAKPGERSSGWAWDTAANRPPRMVLFLDDNRVVRGFAGFTQTREDVAAALRNSRMSSSGWFGFAAVPGNRLHWAYALLNDGRSLCQLSNVAEEPRAAYAIFRRGQWTVDSNRSGRWEPEDWTFQFGLEGDLPVAGDWDGSGVVRAGVFRKGTWYLDWNHNGRWDAGDRQIEFGLPGDLPVVGDWNHTGSTKMGVFRNGTWILDWNGDRQPGSVNRQFNFGAPGDIPVAGDWDGSGVTRIGVFRRGTWYLDLNGNFQLDSGDKVVAYGLPDDQPVPGDWNGLGLTKLGVFRNGQWILDSDGNQKWDPHDSTASFGLPGDIAVSWK